MNRFRLLCLFFLPALNMVVVCLDVALVPDRYSEFALMVSRYPLPWGLFFLVMYAMLFGLLKIGHKNHSIGNSISSHFRFFLWCLWNGAAALLGGIFGAVILLILGDEIGPGLFGGYSLFFLAFVMAVWGNGLVMEIFTQSDNENDTETIEGER